MTLGAAAYHDWIDRMSPSPEARIIVGSFIADLADTPWAAPSTEIPDLSEHPEYEVRSAALDVPEGQVWVCWRHTYATGDVDLMAVLDV